MCFYMRLFELGSKEHDGCLHKGRCGNGRYQLRCSEMPVAEIIFTEHTPQNRL